MSAASSTFCVARAGGTKYLDPWNSALHAGDWVMFRHNDAAAQRSSASVVQRVARGGAGTIELEGGRLVPRTALTLMGWDATGNPWRPPWTPCPSPRLAVAARYPPVNPAIVLRAFSRECVTWLHALLTDCGDSAGADVVPTLRQETSELTHLLHVRVRHARELQWLGRLVQQWLDGISSGRRSQTMLSFALLQGRLRHAAEKNEKGTKGRRRSSSDSSAQQLAPLSAAWQRAGLATEEIVGGMLRAQLVLGRALADTLARALVGASQLDVDSAAVQGAANATLAWVARQQWDPLMDARDDALHPLVERALPPDTAGLLEVAVERALRGMARLWLALLALLVPRGHLRARSLRAGVPLERGCWVRILRADVAMRRLDHVFIRSETCRPASVESEYS